MCVSVTDHILKRYKERVEPDLPDRDIINILEETYNRSRVEKVSAIKDDLRVVKSLDNFVIVGYESKRSVKLVTCFYRR